MGLSHDIISEFVKITNGNKEKPKEGIVYATIVQASDGKYVKIDGSDLLTPTDTTTDIEDGERVTVMIKDHRATVTGNVTAPSASGNRVDKVVEVVSDQLGVFETVVADKVSTNELEAYKATIEHLIAGKAEIEDLEATNAEIENLKVKNAEIENAVIDKATIEDLEAVNAVIENLKAKDAEIENLVADKATINDLNAVNADIENLKAKHAHIEDLVADKADIEDLEATNAEIENLKVKDAEIENLVADKATIEDLEATKAEIEVLDADFAEIKTLVNGNLTSDNILSFNITADKVTMEDAFIKDAMIDTVNAAKINAGRINTNSVVIGSEDGGMRISGATQQFTDKNGNVRIQIGRDSSDGFTFALYGEDGQGQIINQNGITASAIADGLIVNDMVSDNAAISGGKLDISSVVTEINNDNTTTIKSNKIYLDEQNQSLEVAFKSLKTQVDTIKDIDSDLTTITDKIQSNTSKIEANKSSISTLLAEDAAIKKQVTDLEGNVVETTNTLTSKYTTLQQNLDGFKTTVANTYATKSSVNDVKNNLSSNYSTTSAMNSAINQKVDEITASVSSTYATKGEVKSIDDNIKNNYSTTQQMESAISIAKDEINLGVSQVYETKEGVTSKVVNAVNNIQIGGRNYLLKSNTYLESTTPKSLLIGGLSSWEELVGKQVTLSYDLEVQGLTNVTNQANRVGFEISIKYADNSQQYMGIWHYTSHGDFKGKKSITTTFKNIQITAIYYCGLYIQCNGTKIKIGRPKLELGTKATDYTVAPEDINNSIQSVSESLQSFENTVNGAFKDGIVEQAEAKAIEQNINILNNEKADIDKEYTSIYNNANLTGSAKTNLNSAYTSYTSAHTSLISTINTAISDGKTTVTEKASVDSTFTTYKGVLATYKQRVQEALDFISSNKVDNVQIGGVNLFKNSKTILLNDSDYGNVNCSVIENDYVKITPKNNGNVYNTSAGNTTETRLKGVTYTISFEILTPTTIGFYWYPSENYSQGNYIKASDKWQKVVFTYTQSGEDSTGAKLFGFRDLTAGQVYKYKNLKLEKGNKATDYSVSPFDVQNDISNAETNAVTTSKTYTDSQIKLTKESIELGISQTYETKTEVTNKINAVQVGGTNLLDKSSSFNKGDGTTGITSVVNSDGTLSVTATSGNGNWFRGWPISYGIVEDSMNEGDVFTISFTMKSSNTTSKPTVYVKPGMGYYPMTGIMSSSWSTFYYTGVWKKANGMSLHLGFGGVVGTIDIKNWKIEKGNKPTTWSPSINDVENSITTAKSTAISESKSYADSQIKIASDSITQRVEKTETNIETITSTNNKLTTGLNKWLIEIFDRGYITGTGAITVNDLLGKTPTKTFLRDDMSGYINIGDSYLGRMTTNVYLDADYSWTTNARSDDGGTLYLNGVSVLTTGTTAKSVTLNLKQGWNKIVWVYNESAGSDGAYFDTKISSLSQVKIMTAYDQTNINESLNVINNNVNTTSNKVSTIETNLNSITSRVGNVEEVASSSLQGKMLYTDPTFESGSNGMNVYNNAGGGTVTVTRVAKSSDCPTTSGYMMAIKTTGTASPGHGGFYFGTGTRANAIFITKIIAKIPSGYTLNFASNDIGTGGSYKWLTSNAGTGNWKEYIYRVTSGTSGSFSSTNFYYVSGGSTATTSAPVTWYVAMATVFDITASSNIEKRMSTAEQKITSDAIVSTVTSSKTYTDAMTGKVNKTEIISSINQTAEAIKINANKIALTGDVVVSAINGGSTTINGSKITTGTISANSITSGTFQGTNFIAGGSSNGNGYFQVKDSSNDVKFHASKDGVYATKIQFPDSISISGSIIQSGNISASSSGFTTSGSESGSLYRMEYNSNLGPLGLKISSQYYNTEGGGNVAGTKKTIDITGDTIGFTTGSTYTQLSQSGTNIYSQGGYDSYNGYYCNGTLSLKKASHGGIDVGNTSTGVAICSKTSPTWWNGSTSYDIFNSGNCTITSGSGGTSYRFANGLQINTMQIWGTWNITTAWGSVYSSPYISPSNYTQAFLNPPQVSITAHGAGTAIMVCQAGAPTTTSPGSYYLWKPVQQTGVKDYIEIISIGRWK